MESNRLTYEEMTQLHLYIDSMEELKKEEPPMYADINKDTAPTTEWDEWNAKTVELNEKYSRVIVKGIMEWARRNDLHFDNEADEAEEKLITFDVEHIIKLLLTPQRETPQLPAEAKTLLLSPYVPVLTSTLSDVLCNLSLDKFKVDPATKIASYQSNGTTTEIEGADTFIGTLSSAPLKLWDTIAIFFAYNNPYGITDGIQTTIEIPLQEYAEARKIQIKPKKFDNVEEQIKENRNASKRKRAFRKDLETDLDNLAKFRITVRIEKGERKGEYDKLALIEPDHSIISDIIQVTIPEKTARYLINSYIMDYPPELQGVDDRNPNTYRLGRKMVSHNSIYNNATKGTNNTLKVSTLVESSGGNIPTLDLLESRRQRNWKAKIKKPLEIVFKNLMDAGILTEWKYRDPKTNRTYTEAEAGALTAKEYWKLDVDYTLKDNPGQMERLLKRHKEEKDNEVGTPKKPAKKEKTDKLIGPAKKSDNEVGTNGTTR